MTNNQFFRLIREYAAHARRTGKSFSDAVTAVHDARYVTLSSEVEDPKKLQRAREHIADVIVREYQPHDDAHEDNFKSKSVSQISF